MDAADGRLVAGAVEWLFAEVFLDVGRSEIIVNPAGHLAVCGRTDGSDAVVYCMLWRIAVKSVCYAGELVVPDPLDAVQRHLPF